MMELSFQPHDLLRIDARQVTCGKTEKDRYTKFLACAPWVVVRRAPWSGGLVPVGLRGLMRSERLAAMIDHRSVDERVCPEDLLDCGTHRDLPSLNGVGTLRERWRGIPWTWGPTGSVGFELTTGVHVCHADSDLDLRLLAPQPMTLGEAQDVLLLADFCKVNTDIQVETPLGGFALREFVQTHGASCLLRTLSGPLLTHNPWEIEECAVVATSTQRSWL